MRKFQVILLPILLAILMSGSCPDNEPISPQPFSNAEEYIIAAINHWISIRIDESNWDIYSSNSALWRSSKNLEELESSLSELGNFNRKIVDIKNTEYYKQISGEQRLYELTIHTLTVFFTGSR